MNEFAIRQVDRSQSQSVETLGSKPKFWFREDGQQLLFKADDRGTGEDWAEVIACHLCGLLGLPHVEYALAAEFDGGAFIRPGAVCESMAPSPLSLVLGNELLLAIDPDYPREQRFKVRQHTIDVVGEIVGKLKPPSPEWTRDLPANVESAMDVFIGYVMLDAWIANQDRHHENWGALWDRSELWLAPTFDHGAALARNLLDSEREERLTTRDRHRTVEAFASRGRSAFYSSPDDRKPLELRAAFQRFADRSPDASQAWLDRLHSVNRDAIMSILDRVPLVRMTETCKRFTLELLLVNQQRLLL